MKSSHCGVCGLLIMWRLLIHYINMTMVLPCLWWEHLYEYSESTSIKYHTSLLCFWTAKATTFKAITFFSETKNIKAFLRVAGYVFVTWHIQDEGHYPGKLDPAYHRWYFTWMSLMKIIFVPNYDFANPNTKVPHGWQAKMFRSLKSKSPLEWVVQSIKKYLE